MIHRIKDLPNRTEPVYGFCYHTMGRTIVAKALKLGIDPLEYAHSYYTRPNTYSAHYVGRHGVTLQCSYEEDKCMHVGLTAAERNLFLSGKWKDKVAPVTYALWILQWGKFYKSPSHLYPGKSPNNVYVGYEMAPEPDATYTIETLEAMCHQAHKTAKMHGFFEKDWFIRSGRFVSHEDINPINRSNKLGGWDVGHLRAKPYVIRDTVYHFMAVAQKDYL